MSVQECLAKNLENWTRFAVFRLCFTPRVQKGCLHLGQHSRQISGLTDWPCLSHTLLVIAPYLFQLTLNSTNSTWLYPLLSNIYIYTKIKIQPRPPILVCPLSSKTQLLLIWYVTLRIYPYVSLLHIWTNVDIYLRHIHTSNSMTCKVLHDTAQQPTSLISPLTTFSVLIPLATGPLCHSSQIPHLCNFN